MFIKKEINMLFKILLCLALIIASVHSHDKFDLKKIKRNNAFTSTSPTSSPTSDLTFTDLSELTSFLKSNYNFTEVSTSSFFSEFLSSDSTSHNLTVAIVLFVVFAILCVLFAITVLIILVKYYYDTNKKRRKRDNVLFIN